ncbi:Rhomboid protein 1 [Yarrowia lipolytica]|jgi:rhomboid-like protein|nr:Rhomboid protein 1 [Yarrowia lipolytica]
MFENMLLKTGPGFRPAQLIGPVFSPQEFGCFFVNMLVLYQFGVPVIMTMESFWFCQMYMISVVSSCTTCSCSPFLGRATMSLGASGAIFSVVGVFCSVFPNDLFNFFSISPSIDAWWLLLVPWPVNQIRS